MHGARRWATWLCLAAIPLTAQAGRELRVGVSGSEPFVVAQAGAPGGIAVEIWQMVAAQAGWRYRFQAFSAVPDAMQALRDGQLDVVVGPISITAERSRFARFSQPFYSSRLAILSRTEPPTLWQRIAPFFSASFFFAVAGLVGVLALVGTLIWLSERRVEDTHFPQHAVTGIGRGIWFAVVTMSTVGYGDLAPKTVLGRIVTAAWIVISVIAATSLVAGIASTLALTSRDAQVIATAEQLRGRSVAAFPQTPGETFALRYGARVRGVASLDEAYMLVQQRTVDAVVFDRPQLQYFLKQRGTGDVAISAANYTQQDYGFALPLDSAMQHDLTARLLTLRESGAIDRIVQAWLGEQ